MYNRLVTNTVVTFTRWGQRFVIRAASLLHYNHQTIVSMCIISYKKLPFFKALYNCDGILCQMILSIYLYRVSKLTINVYRFINMWVKNEECGGFLFIFFFFIYWTRPQSETSLCLGKNDKMISRRRSIVKEEASWGIWNI